MRAITVSSVLLVGASTLTAAVNLQGTCYTSDPGLSYISSHLSANASLSCLGQALQVQNAERYWGSQYSKNASAVVYPATPDDVSAVVQALPMTLLSQDFAIVSGGHQTNNMSSACGLMLDLSAMNDVQIIHNFTADPQSPPETVVRYEGGAVWTDVYAYTNNTGYTAVGARDSEVGVGGFSTGGGIGFLAGAYGYAIDRLVALDVVLMDGCQIRATKTNEYSDLVRAFQGGTGQFGIITAFYQKAAPEPTESQIGVYLFDDPDEVLRAQHNTVDFFNTNTDPFSLVYYAPGYLPPSLDTPTTDLQFRTLLVGLRFNNPDDPDQPDYNATFASFLKGLNTTAGTVYTLPYANAPDLVNPFFPKGLRRGFWGGQVPTAGVTGEYLQGLNDVMSNYTSGILANGDDPTSTVFVLQYMFPGLNGNLPTSADATGWPHAEAGHQTLFSPGYTDALNDQLTFRSQDKFNELAWGAQEANGVFLTDYPNYMSPGVSGKRLYGDNLGFLEKMKDKYDPECYLRAGRTFASEGCKSRGVGGLLL